MYSLLATSRDMGPCFMKDKALLLGKKQYLKFLTHKLIMIFFPSCSTEQSTFPWRNSTA